jgi:hypothetical protein
VTRRDGWSKRKSVAPRISRAWRRTACATFLMVPDIKVVSLVWQVENSPREGTCVDAWCARSELYRECGRWKTTQGKARVWMLGAQDQSCIVNVADGKQRKGRRVCECFFLTRWTFCSSPRSSCQNRQSNRAVLQIQALATRKRHDLLAGTQQPLRDQRRLMTQTVRGRTGRVWEPGTLARR